MNFKQKIFFLLFAIFLTSTVFAQENSSPNIFSDVNISNAKINTQNNEELGISLDIINGEGEQPQVKLNVFLTSVDSKNNLSTDTKVVSDVFGLKEKTFTNKQITYKIPAGLSGKYNVWVSATNNNGFPLTTSYIGEVELKSNKEWIQINPDSCFLKIFPKEEFDLRYTTLQGVDISEQEKIIVNCKLDSSFKANKESFLKFETYYRNSSGSKVSEELSKYTFYIKPSEKSDISFELPRPSKPQAYDIISYLVDNRGEIISNSVTSHFVVRGVSATIQNLKIDKDHYTKGDIAKVSFTISASADRFLGSRSARDASPENITGSGISGSKINIVIKNNEEQICSESYQKFIKDDFPLTSLIAEINIQNECKNPVVVIDVIDKSGKVLDKQEFSIKTESRYLNFTLAFVFILLIPVFYWIFKRNKTITKTIILFLSLFSLLSYKIVLAETPVTISYAPSPGHYVNFQINFDNFYQTPFTYKDSPISITTRALDVSCGNGNPLVGVVAFIDGNLIIPEAINGTFKGDIATGAISGYKVGPVDLYSILAQDWLLEKSKIDQNCRRIATDPYGRFTQQVYQWCISSPPSDNTPLVSHANIPISNLSNGIHTLTLFFYVKQNVTGWVNNSFTTRSYTINVINPLTNPLIDGPSSINIGSNSTYYLSVPGSNDAYNYNITCRTSYEADPFNSSGTAWTKPYPETYKGRYPYILDRSCSQYSQSGTPFYLYVSACDSGGHCSSASSKYITFNSVAPTTPITPINSCGPNEIFIPAGPGIMAHCEPVILTTPICTSFTYSACKPDGTRDVLTSLPAGCTGGNPATTCTYTAPACTSWTYSGWASCQTNNKQIQAIISSLPAGCAGGTPDQPLSRDCVSYERISLMGKETGGGVIEMAVVTESSPYFDNYPLKIRKGGKTYGIIWTGAGTQSVPLRAPLTASKFKVRYKSSDYSIVKIP